MQTIEKSVSDNKETVISEVCKTHTLLNVFIGNGLQLVFRNVDGVLLPVNNFLFCARGGTKQKYFNVASTGDVIFRKTVTMDGTVYKSGNVLKKCGRLTCTTEYTYDEFKELLHSYPDIIQFFDEN